MITVHKYRLEIDGVNDVVMPVTSRVLHIAGQDGSPTIWALVDDNPMAARTTRKFTVVGTGAPVPPGKHLHWGHFVPNYLGTAHCGPFVWHVFEIE